MAKFLGECDKEDKARASDVSKLKADADKFIDQCKQESETRAAAVANLLAGYKKERVAAASAWKDLLSTMASTRKEKPTPIAKAAAKMEEEQEEERPVVKPSGKKRAKGGKKRRKSRSYY